MINEIFSKDNIIYIIITLIIAFIFLFFRVCWKVIKHFFNNKLRNLRLKIKYSDHAINFYHNDNFKPPFQMVIITKYDNPDGVFTKFEIEITNNNKEKIVIDKLNISLIERKNEIKPVNEVFYLNTAKNRIVSSIIIEPHDAVKIICKPEFNVSDIIYINKEKTFYLTCKIKNKEIKKMIFHLNQKNNDTPDKIGYE